MEYPLVTLFAGLFGALILLNYLFFDDGSVSKSSAAQRNGRNGRNGRGRSSVPTEQHNISLATNTNKPSAGTPTEDELPAMSYAERKRDLVEKGRRALEAKMGPGKISWVGGN